MLGSGPVHVGGKLLPAAPGAPVRLQGHGAHGWHTLSTTRTGARGGFRLSSPPATPTAGSCGWCSPATAATPGRCARPAASPCCTRSLASWYDDAGNTACGFHAGLGVANRTLPCGTKVMLRYGGRTVTAVVDDRGPYVGGRDWDLNQNTAAALGFGGVGTVWSSQ